MTCYRKSQTFGQEIEFCPPQKNNLKWLKGLDNFWDILTLKGAGLGAKLLTTGQLLGSPEIFWYNGSNELYGMLVVSK